MISITHMPMEDKPAVLHDEARKRIRPRQFTGVVDGEKCAIIGMMDMGKSTLHVVGRLDAAAPIDDVTRAVCEVFGVESAVIYDG